MMHAAIDTEMRLQIYESDHFDVFMCSALTVDGRFLLSTVVELSHKQIATYKNGRIV